MIGTFWNLCRACPSLPIDKGRTEYRTTYQWYEYTAPKQEIIKQAPQLTSPTAEDGNKVISEKNTSKIWKESDGGKPEINIKRNPVYGKKDVNFFGVDEFDSDYQEAGVRVRSRTDRRDFVPSRRSKSEGPPGTTRKSFYIKTYGSPSPDPDFNTEYVLVTNDPDYESEASGVPVKGPRGNTEYRLQYAWPKPKTLVDGPEEVKATTSRISDFMAAAGLDHQPVPVHRKKVVTDDKKGGAAELEPLVNQNIDANDNETSNQEKNQNKAQFYSEYKKKYRPFSQYDYVAGKFLARDNVAPLPSLSQTTSGSWYEEVIELRKKAGEYRHRGWGTELAPQHLAEVYNKQLALWEHVSRRSSLSALTLVTTTQKPRALTKEEKSKDNFRKPVPGRAREITKQLGSLDRGASVYRRKADKSEEPKRTAKGVKGTPTKHGHRSQSVGPSSGSPNVRLQSSAKSDVRSRPTTLTANAQPRIKRDRSASAKKNSIITHKLPSAVVKINDSVRQSSELEKSFGKLNKDDKSDKKGEEVREPERIIKSPPEPTRVKSPEQMIIRSPEPVNWVIPLDTGTFTVTQNIINGNDYFLNRFSNEGKHSSPQLLSSHHSQTPQVHRRVESSHEQEAGPSTEGHEEETKQRPKTELEDGKKPSTEKRSPTFDKKEDKVDLRSVVLKENISSPEKGIDKADLQVGSQKKDDKKASLTGLEKKDDGEDTLAGLKIAGEKHDMEKTDEPEKKGEASSVKMDGKPDSLTGVKTDQEKAFNGKKDSFADLKQTMQKSDLTAGEKEGRNGDPLAGVGINDGKSAEKGGLSPAAINGKLESLKPDEKLGHFPSSDKQDEKSETEAQEVKQASPISKFRDGKKDDEKDDDNGVWLKSGGVVGKESSI